MTDGIATAAAPPRGLAGPSRRLVGWAAFLAVCIVVSLTAKGLAPAAAVYPKAWVVPVRRWISAFMKWLVESADLGLFTVREATRAVAAVLAVPYDVALGLFARGLVDGPGTDAPQILPPLSWAAVVLLVAAAGTWAGGRRLGLFVGACFLYLAVFGEWQAAMTTLASIVVAVPLGVAGGLAVGLAAYRSRGFERAISPLLDLMQTVPVFAYLVPILVLFGFGPVAAILATVIYAMPPMVRITIVGLRAVPAEVLELAAMIGCTPRQTTWRVLLPTALPALMVGVNQVIMLSLNMVIIASMIGAGGLGFDVLAALRKLDIGGGVESGLAIVVLAVALDRLSQAVAVREARRTTGADGTPRRDPAIGLALAGAAAATVGALFVPALATYPEAFRLTTGPIWSDAIAWINVHFFDTLDAVKNALLLGVLIPVKRFLLELPWTVVVAVVTALGWSAGGLRLAGLVLVLTSAIAMVGLWEPAMVTLYLCGVSVAIAMLIGVPIGIAASTRPRLWRVVEAGIDTLQTLPSFVYLIPVVMLFRVGDFSAMVAVVAYAVVPAVRYTAVGLMRVDPQLLEAGVVAGCTPWQLLTKVKLRLAFPEILLGLNQTVMLALSMLVITALVGTRDLGQEVYVGLTKADVGRGVVAGLAIAFIAIVADRLIMAAAGRRNATRGGH
ncbi:ABC transporter permease [Oharaeibacter diazotrophicus]|uniref:Glycine betaine/proline transport system permease protein n=3 Tax=Oharaeibacter diazotrophicus TaxID=1920512 RepID=A0A4R6RIJ7_9HYPH|nr:ABC transporter permease subunit [Oharaeibacter diazotrophicus]TDP86293.1 glycine betaine/proline transport system permease protein [Oharaeibacter diazotrophicus]BBE71764.1 glycine betaine transport system permease protein OpuAB [Pleomorphomonas sp. SM30]GLS78530.1 ABC transporter permease [Oharaeibacter diazotrophicus]